MMQELNYIRCGDYYIPDIRLPEENRPIGRWGRMHRDYIKEHKEQCKKDRNIILFQYLQQEFDLREYSSLGNSVMLDADTLETIIKTRNDLTHRGDQSKVSSLMYNHLLPILQEVMRKL